MRRGNDNEGPLVDVEQEGIDADSFEAGEVFALEVAPVEEVVQSKVLESPVRVGAHVERPPLGGWWLGVGAAFRVQRDRKPRG